MLQALYASSGSKIFFQQGCTKHVAFFRPAHVGVLCRPKRFFIIVELPKQVSRCVRTFLANTPSCGKISPSDRNDRKRELPSGPRIELTGAVQFGIGYKVASYSPRKLAITVFFKTTTKIEFQVKAVRPAIVPTRLIYTEQTIWLGRGWLRWAQDPP